jgi:hypothetical protein
VRFLVAAAAAVAVLACAGVRAQGTAQAQEHEVKAAFLFKFPAFVEWPGQPGPEVPFVIAVVSAPEIAAELRALAQGRSFNGRPIQVREAAEANGVQGANMVFVGRAAGARLAPIARGLSGAPVLLVSESPGALEQGSMINFVLSEGRVRFDVALDSADAAKLRINARLLAVANSVRGARL